MESAQELIQRFLDYLGLTEVPAELLSSNAIHRI
jgi:hypothetical protein